MIRVQNINPMFGQCVIFEGNTRDEALEKYALAVESLFDVDEYNECCSYIEGHDYVVFED